MASLKRSTLIQSQLEGTGLEQSNLLLQRGGETLILHPMTDRFTVCSRTGTFLTALAAQLEVRSSTPIGSATALTALEEWIVDPDRLESIMQQVCEAEQVAWVNPVYQLEKSPGTPLYLTNELTVQFAKGVESKQMQAIAAEVGLQIVKLVAGVARAFVFRLTDQTSTSLIELANQLMQLPEVVLAEPNIIVQAQPFYRPRDTAYSQQWHLHHEGGENLAQNSHISIEAAWDITRGTRSVVVAIADDGFDLNDPDFQGEGKIVAPVDFKTGGFLPLPEHSAEKHGTACAKLAIAEETGIGGVGVAPGCALMPIGISEFWDDQAIEQVCEWAIQKGASVLLWSWGAAALYFPLSLRQRAAFTRAATQGRHGKGCAIVVAAGNANRPIAGRTQEQDWTGDFLQGEVDWLNGFAVHPDVITVSACTSLNQKVPGSNWGISISITAPSNPTVPNLFLPDMGWLDSTPERKGAVPGQQLVIKAAAIRDESSDVTAHATRDLSVTADAGHVISDTVDLDTDNADSEHGAIDPLSAEHQVDHKLDHEPDHQLDNKNPLPEGTSSAAAIVAGVAALVLSANPHLSTREVKQILQDTADRIVDPEPDLQLGLSYGSYNAYGHSPWFGHGKVNAARAVAAARKRLPALPLPTRWIQQSNSAPVDIPDNTIVGITSAIQIDHSGMIRDIEISIQVEHEFMSDLEILLLPPRGEAILLQSRTFGRITLLKNTYSLQTTPLLQSLLHQPAQGTWQLKLVDSIPLNIGRLQSWQLSLGV